MLQRVPQSMKKKFFQLYTDARLPVPVLVMMSQSRKIDWSSPLGYDGQRENGTVWTGVRQACGKYYPSSTWAVRRRERFGKDGYRGKIER